MALWVAQLFLAALFGAAGLEHALAPIVQAARTSPWVSKVPAALVRVIGVAELAGALGVVLPAALRVWPALTPLAAAGLALLMMLAAPFEAMIGEPAIVPFDLAIAWLAAFVAWGRTTPARIRARS